MKWLEDWDNGGGGEGVTFYNGAVDQDEKKNLMKKKYRNESRDEGVGKRADEEEKKKKNAIRTLRAMRKEKKEKENERNKEKEKKRLKRKKSTKVGIHIPPSPTALEYKNKRKKDLLD